MHAPKLATLPLFSGLSHDELERIAPLVEEAAVDAGATLTAEGRLGYEFFVILAGTAEVRRDGSTLSTLWPGDFFGEIGLLVSGRRTATVVATSPLRLAVMFDRSFRRLEREHPEIAAELRASARRRLVSG